MVLLLKSLCLSICSVSFNWIHPPSNPFLAGRGGPSTWSCGSQLLFLSGKSIPITVSLSKFLHSLSPFYFSIILTLLFFPFFLIFFFPFNITSLSSFSFYFWAGRIGFKLFCIFWLKKDVEYYPSNVEISLKSFFF